MTICQLLVADFKGLLEKNEIQDAYDERNLREAIDFCNWLMEEHGKDYFFSCGNFGGWYPRKLRAWCRRKLGKLLKRIC